MNEIPVNLYTLYVMYVVLHEYHEFTIAVNTVILSICHDVTPSPSFCVTAVIISTALSVWNFSGYEISEQVIFINVSNAHDTGKLHKR